MTVTEVKQALGSWEVRLHESTPRDLLDRLTMFGHLVVAPGLLDVRQYGDALLSSARYVGVLLGRDAQNEFSLKGAGMAYWLGATEDRGDVLETPVVLTAQSFANSVRALLPPSGSVIEGTLYSVAGTYTGTHRWETSRKAITYVTDTFNAEWRVNNNATLDAGMISQLYKTTPTTLLMQKQAGADLLRKALNGRMSMETDVEGYANRVVLLAQGEGDDITTGEAEVVTPYKNLFGSPIKMTQVVSESGTDVTNADTRAALALNALSVKRNAVTLSSDAFDVKGDLVVGDYVDVYDPVNGFIDPAREVIWEGQPINPMALRCVELTWPIPPSWTVAFRDTDGNWIDLSPYYAGETGETTVVVGDLPRSISSGGGEGVGIRPNLPTGGGADATIPAAPVWGEFSTGSYQPDNGEWTKAAVFASWSQPLNSDGSVITDGGHYEIRYRQGTWIGYKVRWGMLGTTPPGAGYRWGELAGNRWGAPITDPVQASGEWHTVYVGWGQTQMLIQELTPGLEYEFQIRAVDSANPPKNGPWSASEIVVASEDLFAPDVPQAPAVASSRIAIQVVHTLGKASGGTFNLQPDLVYLSVHVGGSNSFFPDETNEVGKLIANSAMIQAHVPAVGTFPIEQVDNVWVRVVAVDRAGNKSGPSDAVQASVDLIDDAHISDLTVSKLTAGIITAQSVLAAQMEVGSGGNLKLTEGSLDVYNNLNKKQVEIGKLSDGTYGLAAVGPSGELTKLSDVIYGPQAAQVLPQEFTSSTTFVNLATVGPTVTLTVGPSGRVLLFLTCTLSLESTDHQVGGMMGFQMSGANVQAPQDLLSLVLVSAISTPSSGDDTLIADRRTVTYFLTGLNPGVTTFQAKYKNFNPNGLGTDVSFYDRQIVVFPY